MSKLHDIIKADQEAANAKVSNIVKEKEIVEPVKPAAEPVAPEPVADAGETNEPVAQQEEPVSNPE